MKILVLSHEYPPIGGGGGKVVEDICTRLAERGHTIHVLTAHFGDLPHLERQGNLVIERLRSCRTQAYRANLTSMACFVLACFWRSLKVMRTENPDLIHAHFAVPAGAAAWALSRLSGKPYMITVHGGDVPGGAPQKTGKWFAFLYPFTKTIWKKATHIVSVSQQTCRFALQHYPVDIQVIPNGVDTAAFQPGSLEVHTPARILYIGRFSPEKNASAVPQILAEIKDLPWRCAMLGDGPQMPAVRAALSNHALEERVELTGWVSPAQVHAWLAQSDILLMPSLLDSMPMAGLQALSMGLALVLSDIGSCPEFIDRDLNGILVGPGDAQGFSAALRRLLSDAGLLKTCRAASRAHASNFDLKSAIDAYEQIALEIVSGRA